jgi:hypothetical protein
MQLLHFLVFACGSQLGLHGNNEHYILAHHNVIFGTYKNGHVLARDKFVMISNLANKTHQIKFGELLYHIYFS